MPKIGASPQSLSEQAEDAVFFDSATNPGGSMHVNADTWLSLGRVPCYAVRSGNMHFQCRSKPMRGLLQRRFR